MCDDPEVGVSRGPPADRWDGTVGSKPLGTWVMRMPSISGWFSVTAVHGAPPGRLSGRPGVPRSAAGVVGSAGVVVLSH